MGQNNQRWILAALVAVMFVFISPSLRAQTAPPAETKPSDTRGTVLAHYMVCFFSSVDFYKQEIELAQRHGIDGFALNCGQWANRNDKGEWVPENYTLAAERLYEAARQLNSGFKLTFSPDMNTLGNPAKAEDMVRRFKDHPNTFRHNGRIVLSAWAGTPEGFAPTLKKLKDDGIDVCFVPFFYNPRYAMAMSLETVMRFLIDKPYMDGVFNFGADGSIADIVHSNANGRRATLLLDRLFMAGASPAYNSANLRDGRGMFGYGAAWRGLIRDNADWVELVTWNDYQEDSNLMPFRWPAGSEKRYYVRDESFLEVTGYYSAWFKTGREPRITQDKVFITHRPRGKWNRQAWDERDKKWVDVTATTWPYDQMHDDVGDGVYLDTFLTAPAKLTVELGKTSKSFEMPAGVGHVEVPIEPGVPRITLTRNGVKGPIIDFVSRKAIVGEPTQTNSIRGAHLMNRTWTSGATAGKPIVLEAEAGALAGNASIVLMRDGKGVLNKAENGSGCTLPVKGLTTGTYNIRITYQNPHTDDARLTLVVDGPPRGAKEQPYYIPACFPPTGRSETATISFLLSLYENTTFLRLEWQKGNGPADKAAEHDDIGEVIVDAIELVKVEPWKPEPATDAVFSEMIEIPGGTFTMGSTPAKDQSSPGVPAPDESPRRKVTISPFVIGKFEVTNAQFERFMPGHRKFRDGFSWRDREPVIYVSWTDAVRYCNWLSERANLKPVYSEVVDEKTKQKNWQVDMMSDGYRLPTEAEWEYVASGRGEGRLYPWGNDAPSAKHGNFAGADALRVDGRLRASETAGVTVVGDYPAGASRDGVMDLAGNVCEWCTDWYQPYTDQPQTDPVNLAPGEHRVVRGGSWGYYNLSQRAADREFQNPNYPGYVYIGFRVVRSVVK